MTTHSQLFVVGGKSHCLDVEELGYWIGLHTALVHVVQLDVAALLGAKSPVPPVEEEFSVGAPR